MLTSPSHAARPERRRTDRTGCRITASWADRPGDAGEIRDISEDGLFLATAVTFAPRERLSIAFALSRTAERVRADVEVVHSSSHGMGLRFVRIGDTPALSTLVAEIAERSGAAPSGVTKVPSPRQLRVENAIAAFITLVPHLGLLAGPWVVWRHGIAAADLALCAGFYTLTIFGITLGFHRLFTHRSYEAGAVLRALLAVAGSMALQGPVIRWVADHRRHHAFADRAGDPHSPAQGGWRGLWHAHVGWFFARDKTIVRRFAPDLLQDPVVVGVDRLYAAWVLASLGLPALLGGLIGGGWTGALTGFVWGGLLRIVFTHHVTWSVNSLGHAFGDRPFATRDHSTNGFLLALLTFGEGWHNNHHAFPWSARHGLAWWQIDPSAWVIVLLEKLRLARNVRRVTRRERARSP